MSRVYVARDTLIGRTVAVKILPGSGAVDDATRARFVREAQLAGNVVHENIIRVYDFGEEAGQLYMVMEYLEGEDLNDAIQNGRTGSLADRIEIAIQITQAMEHVHSLNITHRDLKPHNVFVTRNGTAKLMDFGIAKTADTSLTRTGFALGTPSYMAPEQVLGKQVNHLSDIYSFGILLFELITNTKPLQADSLERVFWMVLNDPVDLAPLSNCGAPPALCDLIRRCTEKDPAARPQSFAEVRRELQAAFPAARPGAVASGRAAAAASPAPLPAAKSSMPAASPVAGPAARPAAAGAATSKRWIIPVGAVLAAVIGVGLWLWLRPDSSTAATPKVERPKTDTVASQPAPTFASAAGDMVLVAAGPFLFGENKERRETPAFYIDKTEVTNAAYGDFLKATGYAPPPGFAKARPDFPVVNVTIQDAREFARWAEKRLPTSVEWEKAARGTDGRQYPWGDDPKASTVAVNGGATLRPAGTADAPSPAGAWEMAGNVFELVDERVTPNQEAVARVSLTLKATASEPWCAIRGGSFRAPLFPVWESGSIPERLRAPDIGFRCVRDIR